MSAIAGVKSHTVKTNSFSAPTDASVRPSSLLSMTEDRILAMQQRVRTADAAPEQMIINFRAVMLAPLVVLPKSSTSTEAIKLDFGKIEICNVNEGVNNQEKDSFALTLVNMSCRLTATANDVDAPSRDVIDPWELSVAIDQFKDGDGAVVDTRIDVKSATPLRFKLASSHYRFIVNVLMSNFGELKGGTQVNISQKISAPLVVESTASMAAIENSTVSVIDSEISTVSAHSDFSESSYSLQAENLRTLSLPARPDFHTSLNFHSIDCLFLRDTALFTPASETVFVKLSISGIKIELSQSDNSSLASRVNVSISDIQGIDYRPSTHPSFKKFVSPSSRIAGMHSEIGESLHVSYDQLRNGIVISGLPKSVTSKQIDTVCTKYGTCDVTAFVFDGVESWFALVTFSESQSAALALSQLQQASAFIGTRVSWAPASSTNIDLFADSLALKLSPDLLLTLQEFFELDENVSSPAINTNSNVSASSSTPSSRGRSVSAVDLTKFGQDGEDHLKLPSAADFIMVAAHLADWRLIVIEDEQSPNTRVLYTKASIGAKYYLRDNQHSVELQVTKLQTSSYDFAQPKASLVRVIGRTNFNVIFKINRNNDILISFRSEGLTVKISYRDIKALLTALNAVKEAHEASARRKGLAPDQLRAFTQQIKPVGPALRPLISNDITGGKREDLDVDVNNLTILLVNNIGARTSAVVMLSANITKANVHNWSSNLSGSLSVEVRLCSCYSFVRLSWNGV
jgi:hypothetical protein